jgi:hypothetical protein
VAIGEAPAWNAPVSSCGLALAPLLSTLSKAGVWAASLAPVGGAAFQEAFCGGVTLFGCAAIPGETGVSVVSEGAACGFWALPTRGDVCAVRLATAKSAALASGAADASLAGFSSGATFDSESEDGVAFSPRPTVGDMVLFVGSGADLAVVA